MKYQVEIDIMPHQELLDPQGKAVMKGLEHLGLSQVSGVRMGKHASLQVEAANAQEAEQLAETACKKLLANIIMESYSLTVKPLEG